MRTSYQRISERSIFEGRTPEREQGGLKARNLEIMERRHRRWCSGGHRGKWRRQATHLLRAMGREASGEAFSHHSYMMRAWRNLSPESGTAHHTCEHSSPCNTPICVWAAGGWSKSEGQRGEETRVTSRQGQPWWWEEAGRQPWGEQSSMLGKCHCPPLSLTAPSPYSIKTVLLDRTSAEINQDSGCRHRAELVSCYSSGKGGTPSAQGAW